MHVQGQPRHAANRLDDRDAEADVGHEVPVHDVEVENPHPRLFQPADLVGQTRTVESQQRRPDQRGAGAQC